VTVPPPAGTAAVPEEEFVALSTATESKPPAHPEAIPLTVTLVTFAPVRFWMTPNPSESHLLTVTPFPPSVLDDQLMPDANPGADRLSAAATKTAAPINHRPRRRIRLRGGEPRLGSEPASPVLVS